MLQTRRDLQSDPQLRRPNAVAYKKGLTPVRPQSHSMHVAYLLEQLSLTLSGERSVTRERAERVNVASYAFFPPNVAVQAQR